MIHTILKTLCLVSLIIVSAGASPGKDEPLERREHPGSPTRRQGLRRVQELCSDPCGKIFTGKKIKNQKYFLCHYDAETGDYKTLCLSRSAITKGHMKNHAKTSEESDGDYCGVCTPIEP